MATAEGDSATECIQQMLDAFSDDAYDESPTTIKQWTQQMLRTAPGQIGRHTGEVDDIRGKIALRGTTSQLDTALIGFHQWIIDNVRIFEKQKPVPQWGGKGGWGENETKTAKPASFRSLHPDVNKTLADGDTYGPRDLGKLMQLSTTPKVAKSRN